MLKTIRVITLFSGYDSQCLALNRLGLPYDLVAWAEIDKHACTAHDVLFPQFKDRNVGDVSRVDWTEWHRLHPEPIDLLTYSSPCQDFSSAGLQRGGEEGSGTRSGLLWETERAVRELRPRHLVFENVAGLVSDKFVDLFNRWQARLNGYGYTNFSQLMNAKDYGVPQNRLRIFMVSILDCQRAYYFPKPFPLERRLKDVLEQNVDERYYLSDERVKGLLKSTEKEKTAGNGFSFTPLTGSEEYAHTVLTSGCNRKTDNFIAEPCIFNRPHGYFDGDINKEYSPSIAATEAKVHKWVIEPQINILGQLSSSQNSRIIDTEGISPAVINGEKDGMPKIVEQQDLVSIPDGKGGYKRVDRDSEEWYRYSNEYWYRYSNEYWSKVTGSKIAEPTIAAMRGRDKDNPNDRGKSTDNYAQRLELKPDGTSNTITSVAKGYRDIPGKPGVSEMQFTHPDNESPTVTCEAQIKVIEPAIIEDFYGTVREPRVYTGEAPTLRADRTGLMTIEHAEGDKDNLLVVPQATKEGYAVVPEGGVFDASYPDSKTRRGRVLEGGTVCPTIMASQNELLRYEGIRIRRLTERELYRLMDVSENDIDTLLAARIPRTQHAKLAGNSIVVACLYYIFRNLFVDTEPEIGTQTKLF